MYRKLYNSINQKLFNGELPEAYIQLCYKKPWLYDGLCYFDEGEYFIILDAHLTERARFYTLVHEMVHIWMRENGYDFYAHNRIFKAKTMEAMEIYE